VFPIFYIVVKSREKESAFETILPERAQRGVAATKNH
jgi:hypothetical protein